MAKSKGMTVHLDAETVLMLENLQLKAHAELPEYARAFYTIPVIARMAIRGYYEAQREEEGGVQADDAQDGQEDGEG